MPHPKKFFQKAGMVLTEALVSIATLSTAVIALGTITTNAISTTIISKDYLVAGGLLNEADEAVKNIRYTNLLLKPSDKSCWLRIVPNNSTDSNCTEKAIAGNNYVTYSSNGIWQMQASNAALDLEQNLSTNTNFQVYLDSDVSTLGYYSSITPLNGTTISTSKFFRNIQFTSADDNTATYTVTVQWKDGAKTRTLSKTAKLFNSP